MHKIAVTDAFSPQEIVSGLKDAMEYPAGRQCRLQERHVLPTSSAHCPHVGRHWSCAGVRGRFICRPVYCVVLKTGTGIIKIGGTTSLRRGALWGNGGFHRGWLRLWALPKNKACMNFLQKNYSIIAAFNCCSLPACKAWCKICHVNSIICSFPFLPGKNWHAVCVKWPCLARDIQAMWSCEGGGGGIRLAWVLPLHSNNTGREGTRRTGRREEACSRHSRLVCAQSNGERREKCSIAETF